MGGYITELNSNYIFAIIIIIMVIIFGVVTLHYYAYISSNNRAVLNVGLGGGIKFLELPIKKHENFNAVEMEYPVIDRNTSTNIMDKEIAEKQAVEFAASAFAVAIAMKNKDGADKIASIKEHDCVYTPTGISWN